MKCKKPECKTPPKKLGLCLKHYRHQYYLKHQDLEKKRTLEFKRSFTGRLQTTYQKIRRRCLGIEKQQRSKESYTGLAFPEKEEFIAWAVTRNDYLESWSAWVQGDYAYRLIPTVDRIDSSQGYLLNNMQWLPLHENSRKH